MFIAALCGAAAWTTEVNIVRCLQPPSQPPPAGGRSRVPAPSGGGSGRGLTPCPRRRDAGGPPALPVMFIAAVCAMRMTVSREHGGTRFPHTPAPGKARAQPVRRGVGKPGFPIPPPAPPFYHLYHPVVSRHPHVRHFRRSSDAHARLRPFMQPPAYPSGRSDGIPCGRRPQGCAPVLHRLSRKATRSRTSASLRFSGVIAGLAPGPPPRA